MMSMIASHRIVTVIAVIVLSLISHGCYGATSGQVTTICHLLEKMNEFDGKDIRLQSDAIFTVHGRHLVGSQCRQLGSVALVIEDKKFEDKNVLNFVRKVLSLRGRAHVLLVGRFVHQPSGRYKGMFILDNVIEVDSWK